MPLREVGRDEPMGMLTFFPSRTAHGKSNGRRRYRRLAVHVHSARHYRIFTKVLSHTEQGANGNDLGRCLLSMHEPSSTGHDWEEIDDRIVAFQSAMPCKRSMTLAQRGCVRGRRATEREREMYKDKYQDK